MANYYQQQQHVDPEILTRRLVELENKTGYPIMQTNGQRKCGPRPNWVGPAPTKGSEVFIGKVPRDCFEDELFPLFAQIGPIYELRLMMDFSGTNRGYAFVMYTNPDDARKACLALNNYEIRRGRRLGVVHSKDNCRLFVGKIPRDKTKEDIIDAMSMITEGVVNAIVHTCYEDPSLNRGYAFVEYEDHRSAAMARRKLLPGKTPLWGNVEVQVDWAQPENDLDDTIMDKVSNLYVRNIGYNVTESDIMQLFINHPIRVPVTKVKKIKDFAFVHFKDRLTAERVLLFMRNNPQYGCFLSADGQGLHVMWAKPAEQRRRRNSNQQRHNYQRENDFYPMPAHNQAPTQSNNHGMFFADACSPTNIWSNKSYSNSFYSPSIF